jgi:mannan endo-1,4-beta-mannosidase
MKAIFTLALGLALAFNAPAYTTNLISNGSFESGTNGWILFKSIPANAYQVVSPGFADASALKVSTRNNFAAAPQQDVTAQLALTTNGSTWVTRFAVQVSAPTIVRAWLMVTANNPGTLVTNRFLLAERVVRVTNQCERLDGVRTTTWNGTLSTALLYTESGMNAETNPVAFPITTFDAFEVLPDADGDGLANEEEVPTPTGYGTLPDNRDSDGDGIPDGWEVANGTIATTNDAAADPDHDLASNWQEYWAATSPTNALSYPGRPRTNILSTNALAVLTYLAKLPSALSNRVIVGQHVTEIEKDWSNHVATLPLLTGNWPGIVSFAAEGGPNAVLQMDLVLPRALEVWTNGGIPLIKWQPANPWVGAATSPIGIENIPELLNPAPVLAADQFARSNYLAWRDNVASNLTVLRDAGVVVLFRPFSEMNGVWFWHGNKPRSQWIDLWRDLHDYFTFTRGLTNLLWVYESDSAVHLVGGSASSSGTMVDYYFPGDDLVDIAGHNLYDDDWKLAFDTDAIWRRYGKVFAVPQAGKGSGQAGNTNWSNLTYLTGISNTIPRCSFFCVWNSFNSVFHAISDNAQPSELMNAPEVVTREEVNWRYELPFAAALELTATNQLLIHWQGGVLQHSADLLNWTDLPNASHPHAHDLSSAPAGFWRMRR